MKTALVCLIVFVSVCLVVVLFELASLQRTQRVHQEQSNSAPSYTLARVSIDKSPTPKFSGPPLLRAEALPDTRRVPWNDSIESMRVYRERVEAMKRSGSFQTLPTLQPSKVEALLEANR
jgi:hypothetical protein